MMGRVWARRRTHACLALVSATAVLVGCAKPPLRGELASSQAEVNRVLASVDTEAELTLFTGLAPRICVEVSPTARLCEWRLTKRDAGWAELSATVPTEDRINLVCAFPAAGGARGPDSCAVFPQRSNRYLYDLPPSRTPSRDAKREDRAEARLRFQQQASAELARAQTLLQLVTLMGAAPGSCADLGDGTFGCAWLATSKTYGHGTLAFSLPTSTEDKVRMRCVLPADGSPRASGSCKLEVPGRIHHASQR